MILFLHKKGYTYFSMPRLTIPEITLLIEEHNKGIREEQRQARLAKNKRKR